MPVRLQDAKNETTTATVLPIPASQDSDRTRQALGSPAYTELQNLDLVDVADRREATAEVKEPLKIRNDRPIPERIGGALGRGRSRPRSPRAVAASYSTTDALLSEPMAKMMSPMVAFTLTTREHPGTRQIREDHRSPYNIDFSRWPASAYIARIIITILTPCRQLAGWSRRTTLRILGQRGQKKKKKKMANLSYRTIQGQHVGADTTFSGERLDVAL